MTDRDGTPVWFELITDEAASVERFYGDLAGWSFATMPGVLGRDYRVASAPDGTGVGGVTKADAAGTPRGWMLYFGVADVDAAAAKVGALGGTVRVPTDIPDVGRFAFVADPQGVGFFVMRGDRPDGSKAFLQGPGDFGHGVWIELATPDPDAAFGFYGALFGWTKEGAMPMGDRGEYAFLGAGDARPGAVMSSQATGAPARWGWYVHVPDIDAAVATAEAGGGSLLQGPHAIPGGDFSADLADPHGAVIGVVGPRR